MWPHSRLHCVICKYPLTLERGSVHFMFFRHYCSHFPLHTYIQCTSNVTTSSNFINLYIPTPCINTLFRQWFELSFQDAVIIILQDLMCHLFMGLCAQKIWRSHSEPCASFLPMPPPIHADILYSMRNIGLLKIRVHDSEYHREDTQEELIV